MTRYFVPVFICLSMVASSPGADSTNSISPKPPENKISTPPKSDSNTGGNSENPTKLGNNNAGNISKPPTGQGAFEKRIEIDDFVAFIYTPGPRDPFISPLASGTIVTSQEVVQQDISAESLMAFAEKLKTDLGQRIRVAGVSVPPDGSAASALVLYATGKVTSAAPKDGQKPGSTVIPALPPRIVTVTSGIPVRYPPEETAFISKLAQLVAANSNMKLKRDSRTQSVIFPINQITERGVQISLPGHEEPLLLPVYRDIETYTGAGE